jgi:endonuclease/exonuclease/phosphatase family metal-dependent hydrolase
MKLLNLNLDLRPPRRYFLSTPNLTQRLIILGKIVYQEKPDFITFQEATDIMVLANLRLLFFPDYSLVKSGWFKLSSGLVTAYDHTRWQLSYKKFYPFTNQGKLISKEMADRLLRKGILLTVLDNLKTQERVIVLNVHFTANYGRKMADEERKVLKAQLEQLRQLVEDKNHIGRWRLVAGDFNADFSSPTISEWLKAIGGQAVFSTDEPTICPEINPLCHPDQKHSCLIDNIICFGRSGTIGGRLVFNTKGQFISDHFGQLADIRTPGVRIS